MASQNHGSPQNPVKISLSLGSNRPGPPPAKRPRTVLEDVHAEEQDQVQESEISHFGLTSEKSTPKNVQRIIQAQPNRDWRDEGKRKRQKSGLPGGAQNRGNGLVMAANVAKESKSLGYGLVVAQPSSPNGHLQEASPDEDRPTPPAESSAPQKTEDELAMDALLGKNQQASTVIAPISPPPTEDEAFRSDYKNAPPMATLEQYAAMPVEDFGAALLRGQGWKEGEAIGKQRHKIATQKERVVAKRPALLGLGAKESGLGVELGAWGKGARPGKGGQSKPRLDETSYNPVALKSKKTGEILTEEELKQRLEEQKYQDSRPQSDSRTRSPIRRDDERSHGRSRHRDDEYKSRDYHRSSGRHRSRSAETRHRRRGDRDDEAYRERKKQERRRRDRDDYGSSSSKRDHKHSERTRDYDRNR